MRRSVNLTPDPLHISPTTFFLLSPPIFYPQMSTGAPPPIIPMERSRNKRRRMRTARLLVLEETSPNEAPLPRPPRPPSEADPLRGEAASAEAATGGGRGGGGCQDQNSPPPNPSPSLSRLYQAARGGGITSTSSSAAASTAASTSASSWPWRRKRRPKWKEGMTSLAPQVRQMNKRSFPKKVKYFFPPSRCSSPSSYYFYSLAISWPRPPPTAPSTNFAPASMPRTKEEAKEEEEEEEEGTPRSPHTSGSSEPLQRGEYAY